jgi:hypothetical protein
MKDVYEVLKQKECQAELIRQQISALRQAIPLLPDAGGSSPTLSTELLRPTAEQVEQWKEALRLAAPLLVDEDDDLVSNLRARRSEPTARKKWKPSFALKRIAFSSLLHS